MADNLDTTGTVSTIPVGTKIGTLMGTLSGDATAQIAPTVLVDPSGAEGSWVFTPARLPTALGANGGIKVDVVGDTAAATIGIVTETAPATDTASSGLNGRLQRIAQRLTSLIALIPSALGANGGLKVDIVGDTGQGSTLDSDDGSIAAAQANVALVLNLRYTWNGSAWVRGGWTPHTLISAASTNATSVKASAGVVGYITVGNYNAAKCFLKLYNKASAPTVGTDTPVATFIVPGNTVGGGTNIPLPDVGIAFSTGIAYALTTGAAVADTGAVAASEAQVNIGWL